jgi:hypothetical protein
MFKDGRVKHVQDMVAGPFVMSYSLVQNVVLKVSGRQRLAISNSLELRKIEVTHCSP